MSFELIKIMYNTRTGSRIFFDTIILPSSLGGYHDKMIRSIRILISKNLNNEKK